jgi:glucose-6-phosphate isomerase
MLTKMNPMALPAVERLRDLKSAWEGKTVAGAFEADSDRFNRLHIELPGLLFDYSKQRVDSEVMNALVEWAQTAGVAEARDAQFAGEPINATEGRAVLHMALRGEQGDGFQVGGVPVMPEVLAVRDRMLRFADAVRADAAITDVVNIGIGGSDLGPEMVVRALRRSSSGPRVHFVSNVDGAHLESVLEGLHPSTTLFIVVSKTFTTQETMTNAGAARLWVAESEGEAAVAQHFAAVSSNVPLAEEFGIPEERVFGFSDWVGGRYSLWGPVGLAIAIAAGSDAFKELLRGARDMDQHFKQAPLASNAPVVAALIGCWNVNFWGFTSHAVLCYAQDLSRFAAYLQQADMESNGKSIGRDGLAVGHATGPVVWGEAGTNGQHAFYQLLHQGTAVHPADLVAFKAPLSRSEDHHRKLLANVIAQAEAFMKGKSRADVEASMRAQGRSEEEIARIAPHRVFEGNRPSSFFLFDALTPHAVGQLIALHEHRIFVQGVLWNILSFDQWGVELGKELASSVLKELEGDPVTSHDASTAALIAACTSRR